MFVSDIENNRKHSSSELTSKHLVDVRNKERLTTISTIITIVVGKVIIVIVVRVTRKEQ